MKKLKPGKIVLGLVGLAVGVVAVLALREATLSTHQRVPGRGMELVVSADTRRGEPRQTLAEMVEAQLLSCRLEVTADLAGPIEPVGDDRFRAVLDRPLDDTDQRQFRGCVEDWIIDHVQLGVIELSVLR